MSSVRYAALLAVLFAIPPAGAQTLSNTASGSSGGVALDTSSAGVTLNRLLVPGAASVAEISPNLLAAGSTANVLNLDILPTVRPGDPVVDQFTVTAPAGYAALSVLSVSVAGVSLAAQCPTPGPAQYCATVAGSVITLQLGDALADSTTDVRIRLSANTPAPEGVADFVVGIVSPGGVRLSTPGDADGDPSDANSLTVRNVALADSLRSTLDAAPLVVAADGIAASTITATIRDAAGTPLTGRLVQFASDRGGADVIGQPSSPTDSAGVASGSIRSNVAGISTLSARDVSDSLDLAAHPRVQFTQGEVLRLDKSADHGEAILGDVITYAVVLRNRTAGVVTGVRVLDQMPPDFKYLRGSSFLNGAPASDPTGAGPLAFAVGSIPAFVDGNGNGEVDPGEPGYLALRYQLVVGSGATPGDYRNRAIATDVCPSCPLSNPAEASVRVRVDELFGLGTIIGRVFEDRDRDGRQGRDEGGVANAMVALDDGSYGLTDGNGLYHFVGVRPGDRVVKVNVNSLSGVAQATTEEARIVKVSPGLLAKANFGVVTMRDTVQSGRPALPGLEIAGEVSREPVQVVGTVEGPKVLLNGDLMALPAGDTRLAVKGLSESVEIKDRQLTGPLEFRVAAAEPEQVRSWTLTVTGPSGESERTFEGKGAPPAAIAWDGIKSDGTRVSGGEVHQYQMTLLYRDGIRTSSPVRTFGVNRATTISLDMTGDAFETGKADLTDAARAALARIAELIRRHPQERIFISGYTDSVGLARQNLALSKLRAQSAASYLVEVEKIPPGRLVQRWYGEDHPIATNATPAGRERNRRVEIRGQVVDLEQTQIVDQYRREPLVRINQERIAVDSSGRFAALVPATVQEIDVLVQDARGRAVHSTVPLPRIEILQPSGTQRVPYGGESGPYRVAPQSLVARHGAFRLTAGDARGGEPIAMCELVGRTDPGNLIEVDRHHLTADSSGMFRAVLELRLGYNAYGLLVRNAAGASRVVNLLMTAASEDASGELLIAIARQPGLTVYLPPAGVPVTGGSYPVSGVTDPGNRVRVNGQDVEVLPDGRFHTLAPLPRGASHLLIEAIDRAGQMSKVEREVERGRDRLFILALADGMVGQLHGKGLMEGAGRLKDTGFYADGRLAYYLKGYVAGKYLVTSAFDARSRGFERILADADDRANDRLLTNLDPDRLYAVYGDSSTVVYDAQSQGRFYLAVESEEFQALVGNYPMSLTDTELSSFQRTLHGARVQYRSMSRTRSGAPRTAVALLGAEARQVHVRDELRGTGGSVYYLSHADVIEGSEQISLAVRDAGTGLVLARLPQQRNLDYTVKYREGRVMFGRPVSSVLDDGALVSAGLLPGSPITLEVDYETRSPGIDQSVVGGHVQQRLGDRVAVGGTYLKDDVGQGGYELRGADAELRAGRNSRLVGEFATSSGVTSRVYSSDDGGVRFQEINPSGLREGRAWKAAADLDVGEWFGRPERATLRAYVKRVEPGFFSNGTLQDQGSLKQGASASVGLGARDRIGLRYDRDDQFAAAGDSLRNGRESELFSATLAHDAGRWGFGTEFQSRRLADRVRSLTDRSSYGSASLWARPSARWTARLEQQATLSGIANDQSRAILTYQPIRNLGLEARGTTGSRGGSLQGGATWSTGGRELYLLERHTDVPSGRNSATVLGARAPIGPAGRAYTEYQWEQAGPAARRIALLGVQRQWDRASGFTLLLGGEYGRTDASAGATRRSALSGGLSYAPRTGLLASMRAEWRRDRGALERRHILWTDHVESRLNRDLVVLGDFRYSQTRDPVANRVEARFREQGLGLAYRPLTSDRVNALARYTRLDELNPLPSDSSHSATVMDVFSGEATVDLNAWVEWSGKGAVRAMRRRLSDATESRTRTHLLISRVSSVVRGPLRLGLEYRVLGQREARDRRQGWLNELTWDLNRNLRVGSGYNFTDFSDNEFSSNDYSVRGWFLRAQGRY